MDVKVLLIVLLAICTTTRAFHTLIPEGKELVYEYEGTVSASTHVPRPYASSFTLHGNLHVQKDNQTVFVKFSDLEYTLFNGLDDEYASKVLPIPEELEDFTKAFRIEYDPTGNIAGIATGKDEKQYVVNFKKGISAMFQLDLEKMEDYDNQDIYAFHTVENTVNGKGKVNYNVKGDKDAYYIEVMQEPHSTRHLYTYLLTNVDYDAQESDGGLSRDSQRSCVLSKVGGDKIIDHVRSTGGVYNTPFNGKGEAHVVYTNQSLELTSTKALTSRMEVGDEIYHEGLTYHVTDLGNLDYAFPDVTNGRREFSKERMVVKAFGLIKEIAGLFVDYKIDDEKPDFEKGRVMHELSGNMLYFDGKMLEDLYEKVCDDKAHLNIYVKMLIEVGTHAAYSQVMALKGEGKISDDDFLTNMFANVKFPTKKLVDDMSNILEWDPSVYSQDVYSAAVLSFATLLHKAVERNKRYTNANYRYGARNQHKHDFHPDLKLEEEFPDHKYYEKYVLELVRKLKETKQYELQVLYLQALYNTRMESIVHHLLPAVKGDWWKDGHLRMLAALALSPIVTANEDLTYEIYWPFMTNSATSTSFRVMSYFMIMKSQPSLQRLINIFWVMESMKNHELYVVHYKYATAVAESENPHDRRFVLNVRQILKYTHKPVFRGITGYQRYGYFDEDYSIGEELEFMTIHSKFENDVVLTGSYKYSVDGQTATPYWAFLRIAGFDPSFLKAVKLDTTSKTTLFTWETLKNVILNLRKTDDLKITFIYASNGNVVTTYAYDKNNIHELSTLLKVLQRETMKKITDTSVDVSYEFAKTLIVPTEMGFPAVHFNYVPEIEYTDVAFLRDDVGFSFDFKYKSLTNARRGMSFYNPFLDVFQGVAKTHASDSEMSFRLKVAVDPVQHTLKASWTKESPQEVLFAERTYTETLVYVLDDANPGVLQKSSSSCKNYEFVTLGEEYKTNKTTAKTRLFDIGSDFVEYVFDLEAPLPEELDPDFDLGSGNADGIIRSLMSSARFEELQPADVNYGVTRTVRINELYPVDTIDLTLKLDTEYKKGNNYLYPAVAYKMKLHYAAGNGDEKYTGWAADAKLEMDDGHMSNVFSARVTKTIGDFELAFCAAGDAVFSLPGEDSKSSLLTSTLYVSSNAMEGELCAKNNSLIKIKIQGQTSEEQRGGKFSYETCREEVKGPIANQKSIECLFEYDSLKHYIVNIEHAKMKFGRNDEFSEWMSNTFSESDSIDGIEGVKGNEIQVVFDLPMKPAETSKLLVYTEDAGTSYELSEKLESFNTVYGSMFEFLHEFGLTDVCLVNHQAAKFTNTIGVEHGYKPSEDWVLFLGAIESEPKFDVWIKSVGENNMALKFEFKTHTLVVEPKDDEYTFAIDGSETKNKVWTNDWLYYARIKDTKIVSIYVKNIGCHVIFNGHQASIEYPQIEGVKMQGQCLDGSHLV